MTMSVMRTDHEAHLSVAEQAKAHSRELRRTDRELVRDRHKIENEEQRLVSNEIYSIVNSDRLSLFAS